MNQYIFDLTLRKSEGALTRVLGAAQRRGFNPLQLHGDVSAGSDQWHLNLTVESERCGDVLKQQLSKLHDCLNVEVHPCPQP